MEKYSILSRSIHWTGALVIAGLFALGLWMTDLDYYSAWYQTAPQIHVLIGLILFVVIAFRIIAKIRFKGPGQLTELSQFERVAAKMTHGLLYALIFIIAISGYLITVAGGEAFSLFGWFDLPAINASLFERQEDIAGEIHFFGAWAIILLAAFHALAALKHHFFDGDDTLRRML